MRPNRDFGTHLTAPWDQFLKEVDAQLPEPVELHCLGGFVVAALYGFPRPTADIDFLAVLPSGRGTLLQKIAGRESKLFRKYGVYLQQTGVPSYPEDYEIRLRDMFPEQFQKLRLKALEPHDLVLTKLERNSQKDREDVAYLVKIAPLDSSVLRERYGNEMRPYLPDLIAQRLDTTLNLWIAEYFPAK
jgi:hypothetical protein